MILPTIHEAEKIVSFDQDRRKVMGDSLNQQVLIRAVACGRFLG